MQFDEVFPLMARGIWQEQRGEADYAWEMFANNASLNHRSRFAWSTSAKRLGDMPAGAEVLFQSAKGRDLALVIFVRGGVLGRLQLVGTGLEISFASRRDEQAEVDDALAECRALYPEMDAKTGVPIRFWRETRFGRHQETRQLDCPRWSDIAPNYNRSTRQSLTGLMYRTSPPEGGQLLLWHGTPGTGKTWALQALARAWHDWCRIEYIADPERFLDSAQYMLDLVSAQGSREPHRLFVLEDTGELLAADAKERLGAGLTRFLNLADGLLGRDVPATILVTANEQIGSLHPAVARPGRCAELIEFKALDVAEAKEWLSARNVAAGDLRVGTPLADLFAIVAQRDRRTPSRRSIGFGSNGGRDGA